MSVPPLEKEIGLEVYATQSPGIRGIIRQKVEDFIVKEVLVDGSQAQKNNFPPQVLDSSSTKNRYLICILLKKDWDTFLALKKIADQLGINPRRIQIAGIKDAKAVTSQFITVKGISPEEVEKINVKGIHLHPVGYFRHKLSSYYLLGNHFHITIRDLLPPKPTIKKRITKTREQLTKQGGPPNFFGHQRFGTTRPITHLVGKEIVKGDFRKAVMLYLAKASPHEHPQSRETRQELHKTQDFKKALETFPRHLHYERWMLNHLTKHPQDFIGAYRRLPTDLRRLLPQAYQSYLFNKFLSARIKKGLPLDTAKVGDYLVHLSRSGRPMLNMYQKANSKNLAELNKAVQTNKMKLALPIVGFKQKISSCTQGSIEQKILEDHKVDPEDFKIKEIPEISLKGRLRTILIPLHTFSLDETSQDRLHLSKLKAEVSFRLQRGSYATVVLREFMKPQKIIHSGF
ncbi:MAG: tRNA pseudouridine(13) synthase TruD [Thermoproteota archaeon]